MRYLVTGGAGFIGSNFVRRHIENLEADSHFIVLDALTYSGNIQNLETISNSSRFKFVKGNILDQRLMLDLMKQVDVCINFAAESHVDRSIQGPIEVFSTNAQGTLNLLEAARASKINKFVQVSTDEVYGSIRQGSWDEESPLLPNSPYSASKASADLLVRSYFKTFDLNVNITRCSNNYGPYQYPEKLIPFFLTNLTRGKQIPVYGDGLNVRDWLHVNDHCDAIDLVVDGGAPGEIYNIGGGLELKNVEIADILLGRLNLGRDLIKFVEDRKGHDYRYAVNYDKIKSSLGYSPKVPFELGIESTINWYESNSAWWQPLVGE